ncbi:unnamed protein product [Adineta ricciae]|uniref:Uncharacterized protein n=1 Tax=Adineta ricciae TaxID=249248 RepID=A0A814M9M0_ADIRI|nr:unnamed protein product [Adineta ricciae]
MMISSRRNNPNPTRLPAILPNLGDMSHRQQPNASHRPLSATSTQSIDNAYSLEHLFTALHRRIQRISQNYNAIVFHDALKVCARVFQSYASYNLNTIDEFTRHLCKNVRDNKKVLSVMELFHQQISELRHCHSTFEAELLVTTLVIDFHENDLEQQPVLPVAHGKFSPRSRLSKVRHKHIRQAMDFKSQLRQTNEHLQILLYDEFNANLSDLWEESEKAILLSVPFHDHHMTYILRLIPDTIAKFEYALQICTKLFELETLMSESYPQTNRNNKNPSEPTPFPPINITPRSDYNQTQDISQQKVKTSRETQTMPLQVVPTPPITKLSTSTMINLQSSQQQDEPSDHHEEIPSFPSADYKNDQLKLQILLEQLNKRLSNEESTRQRLSNCIQQTTKKYDQLNQYSQPNMLTLIMSDNPAALEYQKALCSSDCKIYKSIEDELDIALKETQHRIDWIETIRQRVHLCLGQQ